MDETLQPRVDMKFPRLLRDTRDLRLDPVPCPGVPFFTKLRADTVRLCLHPLEAVVQTQIIQDHLRCREDLHELQLLNRALAQDIEAADGFNLVVPEFHADRIILCEVKNIENVASDCKLPRPLDLVVFFIAHGDQPLRRSRQIHHFPPADPQYAPLQDPHRDLRCQKRREGGHHRHRLSFDDPAEALQTFLIDLIAAQIRLIEDQVSGGKHGHIPVIKRAVLCDLPRPQVAVGKHQPQPSVFRDRLLPAQRVQQMRLLRVHTAVRQDTPALVRLFCALQSLFQYLISI